MTINLSVYLKRKPPIEGFIKKDFGLELIKTDNDTRTYRWFPHDAKEEGAHIYIKEHLSSSYYHDWLSIENISRPKNKKEDKILKKFIQKIKKSKGSVNADENTYMTLQNNSKIEKLFKEDKEFFKMLRFSQGKPLYQVDFEAKIYALEDVLASMIILAQFLAARYEGLIWNESAVRLGVQDSKILHDMGSSVLKKITSKLEEHGLEWEFPYKNKDSN